MNEQIYLHSLAPSGYDYDSKNTIILLEKILKSKAVLSSAQRGVQSYNHFSGKDYISLSDYEKRFITKEGNYNGFQAFAKHETSIAFPKGKFQVIQPTILEKEITKYRNYRNLLSELGRGDERFSDLEDEVQVKDRISLEYMNGILLPSAYALNYWKSVRGNIIILKNEVEKYRELLSKYGYDVPICDVETLANLEDEGQIEKLVAQLKMTKGFFK